MAPFFVTFVATLQTVGAKVWVYPQAIVIPTSPKGLSEMVRVGVATAASTANSGRLRDAIALVDLPVARWSTAKPFVPIVEALFAAGVKAAMLVTNGPTGRAIALNTGSEMPLFSRPIESDLEPTSAFGQNFGALQCPNVGRKGAALIRELADGKATCLQFTLKPQVRSATEAICD